MIKEIRLVVFSSPAHFAELDTEKNTGNALCLPSLDPIQSKTPKTTYVHFSVSSSVELFVCVLVFYCFFFLKMIL